MGLEIIDLVGKTFGRLTVIKMVEGRSKGKIQWECTCSCGKSCTIYGVYLRNGDTKSCGCLFLDKTRDPSVKARKHGLSSTAEYRSWRNMVRRTTDVKDIDYSVYGKLGMEEDWQNNFESFLHYMGKCPPNLSSIGRIDNNVGYYKGNLRWEDNSQQSRNKGMQSNNTSGFKGVSWKTSENYIAAVATWVDLNGKSCRKEFSAGKYGLLECFSLAVSKRLEEVEKLINAGQEYTQNHIYGNKQKENV